MYEGSPGETLKISGDCPVEQSRVDVRRARWQVDLYVRRRCQFLLSVPVSFVPSETYTLPTSQPFEWRFTGSKTQSYSKQDCQHCASTA